MAPMNDGDSRSGSQAWDHTVLHPHLPGVELETLGVRDKLCIYDPNDSEAYLIGDAVEVGIER